MNNSVTYFDSFDVEYISKEIKKFIGNKNIQARIFRIQAYWICGYFCTGFINFTLKEKILTDFTSFFAPNDLKNKDVILNYFRNG